MRVGYLLSGGAPVYKKYKSAAGHAAGIVVLRAASGATGVSTSTTTSFANVVGLTQDAGNIDVGAQVTYSTTQGQPEHLSTVCINPDAVLIALMVGSAGDAILTDNPVTIASSDGLTVVMTNSISNLDEGTVWYISGPNAGQSRKITSVSSATATVIMPFPRADAIGNSAFAIAQTPGSLGVTLSTALKNVLENNTALGSDAAASCVDLELNGLSNSYIHLIAVDHVFGVST